MKFENNSLSIVPRIKKVILFFPPKYIFWKNCSLYMFAKFENYTCLGSEIKATHNCKGNGPFWDVKWDQHFF